MQFTLREGFEADVDKIVNWYIAGRIVEAPFSMAVIREPQAKRIAWRLPRRVDLPVSKRRHGMLQTWKQQFVLAGIFLFTLARLQWQASAGPDGAKEEICSYSFLRNR